MSFIHNARTDAEKVLQRLDPRFDPRVFFVGFRLVPEADKPSHGVGPEGTPFKAAEFNNVRTRAAELEKLDLEFGSFWAPDPVAGWTEGHERLQKSKERGIHYRALCKAVAEVVDASPANKGFLAYCGWPVDHNENDLVLILNWTPKTGPMHKVEFGVDARAGTGGRSWRGSVGC